MNSLDNRISFPILDQYRQLVMRSRELARIYVRQSFLTKEYAVRLEPYGGIKTCIGVLFFSTVGIVAFGSQSTRWAEIVTLCLGPIVAYIVLLSAIAPIYIDINVIRHGRISEDYVYGIGARKFVNRFTILVVLPILVIGIGLLGIISIDLARQSLAVLALVALACFLVNLLLFSRKNFDDYGRTLCVTIRETIILDQLFQVTQIALR